MAELQSRNPSTHKSTELSDKICCWFVSPPPHDMQVFGKQDETIFKQLLKYKSDYYAKTLLTVPCLFFVLFLFFLPHCSNFGKVMFHCSNIICHLLRLLCYLEVKWTHGKHPALWDLFNPSSKNRRNMDAHLNLT